MKPEDLVLGGMAAIVLASAAIGCWALCAWRRAAVRADAGGAPIGTGVRAGFAASLTLFLAATLLLGLEGYLRFAYDATDSFALTKTTRSWFDRHYQRNSWNVRDDAEYTVAKRTERRRISFVGDSFTVGHGVADVEDRFANRLRTAHPEWEVHVLARNGLDSQTQLGMVAASLDAGYETDEIVLVYCLNDIVELVPEWQETADDIYRGVADAGFLVRHSYAVNQLYFRLWKAPDPEVADYFGIVSDAYEGPVWKQQERLLRSFVALARGRGIRFRVVTFPFLHALGPDYPYATIHARLDALWDGLGVPHLDLLEVYAERAPDELVVNHFDAHPNEVAHALAAAAIDDFLGVSEDERQDGPEQESFLDQSVHRGLASSAPSPG